MDSTPNIGIHLLARLIEGIEITEALSTTEKVFGAETADVCGFDGLAAAQGAVGLLAADVLANGAHGGVATGFFDVGAGHAGGDADEVVEVEVCGVDFGTAENEGEDIVALGGGGEGDGEFLGHAAENGFIDVLDAVCGAEDADALGVRGA